MRRSRRRLPIPAVWPVAGVLLSLFGSPVVVQAAPGDFEEAEVQVVWKRGGEPGSRYGWAIASLEDVDGDGIEELIVGAPRAMGAEGQAGLVEVLSGRDGSVLWSVTGEGSDQLGYAMADAGDIDGDGVHDVIVGAPGFDQQRGRIEVRRGADGLLLLAVEGAEPGAFFGSAVAGGGMLDPEPGSDLVVGAESATDGNRGSSAGAVFAIRGEDGGTIWEVRGEAGERLGSGAAHLGDVDGDGLDDPLVGARDAGDGQSGAAWVLDGATGAPRLDLRPGSGGGDFGWFFVAGLGDIDGDEVPDVYVGDFAASASGAGSGRAHVFSGAHSGPLLTLPGSGPGEGLGPGRRAGDVDGDGITDLVVGAYNSSAGASQAGRVFVVSASTGELIRTITSVEAGEQLGFDAVGLGDVDADGAPELALSAARGDHVYLVAGVPPMLDDEHGDSDTAVTGGASEGTTDTTDVSADPDSDAAGGDGCGCREGRPSGWPTALVCLGLFVARASRRR